MLRPLIERFHSGGGHSQRQRRVKTAKLQLHQLEAFCGPELLIGKQIIKLFGSADRAKVLRRVSWTEGSGELGVLPVWQLVVRSENC